MSDRLRCIKCGAPAELTHAYADEAETSNGRARVVLGRVECSAGHWYAVRTTEPPGLMERL